MKNSGVVSFVVLLSNQSQFILFSQGSTYFNVNSNLFDVVFACSSTSFVAI